MRPLASAVAFGSAVAFARLAHAATAWGDASLTRDDIKIEIDEGGRATVHHTVSVHVSGKRFRAFTIDGVDDGVEAPSDAATLAGRDGPGWPALGNDAKGQPIEAFVEPAKEPRKLRVRLGIDGVPRGDYTVQIRYHVDFAKLSAFSRDGAMTRITWSAPRWPEGYDGAKLVIVVPAAKDAPTIAVADVGGEGEHPLDGYGIVTLRRGPLRDEIELTRPHVAAHDDARFILRIDPHALPGVAASAAAIEADRVSPAPLGAAPRARLFVPVAAALIGLLLGLVAHRRNRDAAGFRPLLPGGALLLGVCVAGAIHATWTTWPLLGALLSTLAIAVATLRAPCPDATRAPGRWLAIPEIAIPPRTSRVLGPFDIGGRTGKSIALTVLLAAACAFSLLLRKDPRAAIALAITAPVLLPLLLTGSSRQLPPDRVADAWAVLAPIAAKLDKPRIIARTVGRSIDEVRLRIDARSTTIRTIEIGCAIIHGPGGCRAVPELLVRVEAGARLSLPGDEDDHVVALGRTDDEQTVCVRPTATDPVAIAARVASLLLIAGAQPGPAVRAAA